jgi:hypothetical protein
VGDARIPFNVGKPCVPGIDFGGEGGGGDGGCVEGAVDHESGVGEDGYFDYEGDFSVGEGALLLLLLLLLLLWIESGVKVE